MNEYQKMLHEIEAKKLELEQRIAKAVQAEISQWQKENSLPVQNVYVDLVQIQTIGESKTYEVASASVDIDFKP
ncbi:hypothetical protein [Acinetobacter bereziniae]|uniref:hypothetical protein n=1 Tax=Acinetobacter bereziniae TaxID=106648 RepID=UPI0019002909|nr:hypothetical protein [Acinetobacter bereziniae]MBJ9904817.1 hypothetical protein [Acinetobacter bereziniae]MCU4317900.1 hypothetical protein [Acinetobacter bereziniae]MCU4600149.1 hypothetical protein [Acinetobacter bereziniae]